MSDVPSSPDQPAAESAASPVGDDVSQPQKKSGDRRWVKIGFGAAIGSAAIAAALLYANRPGRKDRN